ncbi:diaminopimelate decarboxylase [Labrenzia sp. EL_126]|nr:diaminopimelate decarboxylase [Labrenzia sp. EL_126]
MNRSQLLDAAEIFGTPMYAYDLDAIRDRLEMLKGLFEGRFGVSYAIKANPNLDLMRALLPGLTTFDASSWGEVARAQTAGMPADRITFSGPAKRPREINKALNAGIGELVLESIEEARFVSDAAQKIGRTQPVLLRINPLRVPRGFGASMAGTASQFGVDEEDMALGLEKLMCFEGLNLIGFHIYSGTNSRDPQAITDNFAIFADIFRKAQKITGIAPRRLVFGSGFGISYLPDEDELDHAALPALINPIIDELKAENSFANTRCSLELGRWLVGPYGWLLTGVISQKRSRGVEIRSCDAGFNNHLAACGMMGSVIRRNWIIDNISNPQGQVASYMLTGPLCTTIDRLALNLELPQVRPGDVISVASSGAYGLTASPTRFISHPEPREVVWDSGRWRDATERQMNTWDAEICP